MADKSLLNHVMELTGLPTESLKIEMNRLVEKNNSTETIEMEHLRQMLAEYLQEVFLEIKAGENTSFQNKHTA